MTILTDTSLDDPVLVTTESGQCYRAIVEEGTVAISYQDHERWVRDGEGFWDGSSIADCNCDLGEDGFDLLNAAIREALAD